MTTVSVNVYTRDVERIIAIGSKPWGQVTAEERKEYDGLISLYGSMVCHAVLNQK